MEGERGEGRKDMRCGWLSDEQVGRKWKEHDDDAWVQEQQEAPLFRSVGARDTVRCAVWCGGADGSLHRPNPVQIWRALPPTRFPTPKHASPYY